MSQGNAAFLVSRAISVLAALLLCSCGAARDTQAWQTPSSPLSAEFDSYNPAQIPAGLADELKAELMRVLAEYGTARQAAAPPSGAENTIGDFQVVADGGGARLEWSYRCVGDYDQNGEVNIADLTPIGRDFGATAGSGNWPEARLADGDDNGEVNIADVTPVGRNFHNQVARYGIYSSTNPSDYPASPDAPNGPGTVDVGEVALSEHTEGLGGWNLFTFNVPTHTAGTQYWVRPQDGSGTQGSCSALGAVSALTLNVDPGSTNQPSSGSGTLADPYYVGTSLAYDLLATHQLDGDVTANPGTTYIVSDVQRATVSTAGMLTVDVNEGVDFSAYATYSGETSNTLHFWTISGSNTPPTAALTANPSSGTAPLTVNFDASGSADTDGSIVKFEWDWDGTGSGPWDHDSGTQATATHEYTAQGTYQAWVRATDDGGAVATDSFTVNITGSGTQSDWWMFGRDPRHTRRSEHTGPQLASLKWEFRTTLAGTSDANAVIGPDGTVFVGANNGILALNPDGSIKWQSPTIGGGPWAVVAPDGTVYAEGYRDLYALNTDGSLKWTYEITTETASISPSSLTVDASGKVYVGTWEDIGMETPALFAINADGSLAWKYETDSIYAAPAIGSDGTVYLTSAEKDLFAINPDGSLKWTYDNVDDIAPAIGPSGTIYVGEGEDLHAVNPDGTFKWSYAADSNLAGDPVVGADETIYVGCQDDKLYAINGDGSLKWTYPIGGWAWRRATIGSDGTVYVGSDDNHLYALNADGSLKWTYNAAGQVKSVPAIGSDGSIYFGAGGLYYSLDSSGSSQWTYGQGEEIRSSPAIGPDGTVYVGSNDDYLYAVNPDGTLSWKHHAGDPVWSSPAIGNDGTTYVGIEDTLRAINADGSQKWLYSTADYLWSSPAIGTDGTIYVGSSYDDKRLHAVNPDGSPRWSYPTGSGVNSSPAIGADGTLYVGSDDYFLYAINPDGTLNWKYYVGDTVTSPAIGDDGTIYAGSYDQDLYAINPDGTLKWSYPTGWWIGSSPALAADGTICVVSTDGNLYAVNPDGTPKWSYPVAGMSESSPAVDAEGTFYVGSADGTVYAVNSDGTLKWSYLTGGEVYSSPAIGPGGVLYVGSCDGKLYAFGD